MATSSNITTRLSHDDKIYECNYDDYNFRSERIFRSEGLYEPFVYIIQEVETEKLYIGSKTAKNCLESDLGTKYFTSSNYVNWSSNEFEIANIYSCASNHDAHVLEGLLIKNSDAVWDDAYYNRSHPTVGFNTSGTHLSEETKKKLKKSRKERIYSIETRNKISKANSGKNNAMYGKTPWNKDKTGVYSNESIEAMRKGNTGKKHTPESRMKLSNALKGRTSPNKGKVCSEETIRLLREVHGGENNGMYGKTHSEESINKISEIAKNRRKIQCPHCNREIDSSNYGRWHGSNCKQLVENN